MTRVAGLTSERLFETMLSTFRLSLPLSLCLTLGCAETPRTIPTDEAAKIDGIIPAVTFLDSPRLQEGTGEMDADAPQKFQTTPSGIQYRILRKSEWEKPTAKDSVTAHYRGWLDDGHIFDSSYNNRPIPFSLRHVVRGWTEGLQLIGVGGMIELWIPPNLGYGRRGQGAIPPDAPLHFIVELKSIN